MRVSVRSVPDFMIRAASNGVSVNDTSSDTSVAAAIVKPNSLKNPPIWPLTSPVGANTTTSTSVIAIAARPISARPISAASNGASPRARCRKMFSSTTMESSTRMPMVSVSPSMLRKLRLNPISSINTKVVSSVVGMDNSTMPAARALWRNSSRMMLVRMIAKTSSSWIPSSDSRTNGVVSCTTTISLVAGSTSRIPGIASRTASVTSVRFEPLC
ncbi:MAG: hypothetical protein O2822_03265 [Chloroflexi bacterium]|nr:hypothetical protein [Chloroflexota bacterium]